MSEKQADSDKAATRTSAITATTVTCDDGNESTETTPRILNSISMDSGEAEIKKGLSGEAEITKGLSSGEAEITKKGLSSFSGSIKRRSIRRRSSKRFDRQEESYGINTEAYDAIRTRVLQEKAVVNATEALQERWRMIMFMYDDCVDMNETRKGKLLKKLCVKRQEELILIIIAFVIVCLPVLVLLIVVCR